VLTGYILGGRKSNSGPKNMVDIKWRGFWKGLQSDAETLGLQRELEKEVGPKHPLWGRQPKVIGRCTGNDDIVVRLSDDSFATVHLVWHGKIDSHPEKYPWTEFYSSASDLEKVMF
jgi:hypothetical protein